MIEGQKTTDATSSGLIDEVLGNRRSGSTQGFVRQTVDAFGQQLVGAGPVYQKFQEVDAKVNAISLANLAARKAYSGWTALAAAPGTATTQAAEVLPSDGGTHVDPVTGATVENAGLYLWSASPAGWRWVAKSVQASKGINLIANGGLKQGGFGVKRYVPDFLAGAPGAWRPPITTAGSSSGYRTAISTAAICTHALEVPPLGFGNMISQEVLLEGGYLVAAVDVLTTGDWTMGGGLSIIMRHTDGTRSTISMSNSAWRYIAVAGDVRRYICKTPITVGKTVNRIDLALNDTSAPSRTATFYLTGFWVSWSAAALDLADTLYPTWDACSTPRWLIDQVLSLQTQITDVTSQIPSANPFELFRRALRDNLRSIDMVLLGDSNTWGLGATGSSPQTPRNHTLADVRNNVDAPSWANLLRKYLGSVVASGKNRSEPAPGAATYYEDVLVDPIRDPAFSCRNLATGAVEAPLVLNDPRSAAGRSSTSTSTSAWGRSCASPSPGSGSPSITRC